MGEIRLTDEKVILTEDVETFYEKEVTPFGNSAKIGCPKEYIGRKALVIVLKEDETK
ncbi:transposase [candidate division MSBL1 archaeon SCGC-AAA259M10]|uniref:Transposase n=5 Tax=candidate division MSBL1 TaxID=215777 RepID=A0A133UUE5_9EURY|nr:transposase [candidate division MSBL1 archaeon SCGC-AAA259D14]KXA93922.1 transposase [candidate division MSBL1 archaeon SCGC-AAA259E22]KXA95310.1 transposase [candidate division MSBL1 archaeon SCGC-AAA259I07]KXA97750.1 transposase [candidate division MSBL1 archaeon SCGC-AAA259I14]KXA99538.1 transposase [candidate division MSBL1 archaeon SCGC-AAA259M10]